MEARNLLLELATRAKHSADIRAKVLGKLFKEQQAFFLDPSRYKAAVCSRRAGKSFCIACYLLDTAIRRPNTLSVYLGLTRKSAKRILWGVLKKLCKEFGIAAVFKETELILSLQNGSQVIILGANDEATSETLRGNPYALVCIDEVASYRGHISDLIDEVIVPALLDFKGSLVLIGTPSSDLTSYFHEATTNKALGWATHKWTLFENPHIVDAADFIKDLKRRKGWTDDNPVLLREYYGQWIRSEDDLVYRFNPLRNVTDELPVCRYKVMGVDIGYEDATVISVLGFDFDVSHNVYVLEVHALTRSLISNTASVLQRLISQHQPVSIVGDYGGLGKAIFLELNERYGLNIKPAEKREKNSYIELLNSDLVSGKLKVPSDSPVIEEWQTIQWIERSGIDDKTKARIENPAHPNDRADSVLYAWRECKHFAYQPKEGKPKYGTREWAIAEEQRMVREAEKKLTDALAEGSTGVSEFLSESWGL